MTAQHTTPSSPRQTPREQLREMINGCARTPLIYVAAKLGIADLLKDGPKTVDDIAQSVGAVPRNLYRVLRALASMGIFAETPDGTFALTPLAEVLRDDVPDSQKYWAIIFGEEWWWRPWSALLHTVQTGETAFDHIFGTPLFEYLSDNLEAGAIFDASMTSRNVAAAFADYDLAGTGKIVDVGGGEGALIASLLKTYPQMQGILFDRPQVMAAAQALIATEGVGERCQLEAGSFFDSVPPGGDVYTLSSILHNWNDVRALAILQNCCDALQGKGKLLVGNAISIEWYLVYKEGVAVFNKIGLIHCKNSHFLTLAEFIIIRSCPNMAVYSYILLEILPE